MTKPTAIFRATPDDFFVEELPAYEPSGTGEHLYVTFEKRGRDTLDVVRAIARVLGVDGRDAGTAGLKDRHAVTIQTASFAFPASKTPPPIELENVRVLRVARHGNKLRTGHLRGNRFRLVLRRIDPARIDEVERGFEEAARSGVPNRFGEQRFGRHGDNVAIAMRWLTGKSPVPRDPRIRRLQFSAVQSDLFHRVLDRRVASGTWNRVLDGDIVKLRQTRGMFISSDPIGDTKRAEALDVDPTGPIYGAKMRWPERDALAIEREILRQFDAPADLFEKVSSLGEGARRPLRVVPERLVVTPNREEPGSLTVEFVLPKGAYATTVISAVLDARDASRDSPDPTPSDDTEESE